MTNTPARGAVAKAESLKNPPSRHPPARRRGGFLLAGLAAALTAGATQASAGQELLVGVSLVNHNLPVFMADEHGHFRAAGVAARLVDCGIGKRCLEELQAGRLDMALVNEYPIALAIGRKEPVAILATIATAANTNLVITRKDSGIRRLKDLAGHRVALVPGTSAHYALDSQLLLAGTEPRSVKRVDLSPAAQALALDAGRVDAVSVWQPWAHQLTRHLGPQAVVLSAPQRLASAFCLATMPATLGERRPDVERVLQALARAADEIARRPQEAQAVLMRRLDVDMAYVQATWRDVDYALSLGQPLVASLEGQIRWAVREGLIPAAADVNVLDHIEPGPLKQVRARAVTLVR